MNDGSKFVDIIKNIYLCKFGMKYNT